jgi:hypothetical protein
MVLRLPLNQFNNPFISKRLNYVFNLSVHNLICVYPTNIKLLDINRNPFLIEEAYLTDEFIKNHTWLPLTISLILTYKNLHHECELNAVKETVCLPKKEE